MLIFQVLLLGIIGVLSEPNKPPLNNLTLVHGWRKIVYGFDTKEDYDDAVLNGYDEESGFKRTYDVDMFVDKNKIEHYFVSTPRVVDGIPYTLAKVSNEMGKYGPLLKPYPDYKSHSKNNTPVCDGIISVFRIFITCDTLWAIDTGRDFYATPSTQPCPPKIIAFDLNTNERILTYVIPEGQYVPEKSVHNGIIVSMDDASKGKCENGKVYLTDARGFSYLVFDIKTKTSWVIFNELFKANPNYTTTTILGESFMFPDGLYTSTPIPKKNIVFLHSYASINEIAANLDSVNNPDLWRSNPSGNQDLFKVIGSKKTQSAVQALDLKGKNIYFSQLDPLSILSWDPDTAYDPSNFKVLVQNDEILQFVAGIKIRLDADGKEVGIFLTMPLQKLNLNTVSSDVINFRIMKSPTSVLQKGKGDCGCS